MELEPDVELTPLHLRWDTYRTGTRDGVVPQKIEHEYESRDGSGDGGDPPDNYLRLDGGGTRDGSGNAVDPPDNYLRLCRLRCLQRWNWYVFLLTIIGQFCFLLWTPFF